MLCEPFLFLRSQDSWCFVRLRQSRVALQRQPDLRMPSFCTKINTAQYITPPVLLQIPFDGFILGERRGANFAGEASPSPHAISCLQLPPVPT